MASDATYTFKPDVVPCPGETIKEVLDERGITQKDFALRLGRTEKNVSQLVNGKAPITPETAIELERVLGVPASFWNNAEARYRDHLARSRERERFSTETGWAGDFPTKQMADNGWIAREATPEEQAGELLRFFGVSSSDAWRDYWGAPKRLAARMSTAYDADTAAVIAWLRQGEIEAQEVETAPFDATVFRSALREIRTATRLAPAEWEPLLRDRCAEAGVAVVLVRELPKTRCSAATWWPGPGKAVIELCLRYRTDDHFWFSFFHEAAHVLLHERRHVYIKELPSDEGKEAEADRWAADFLIPPADYQRFPAAGRPTKARVLAFADELGIAPGIVVGRLQHDEVVPHSHMNGLKQKLEWAE
jgi:HTH-type transcriptional regulator/antitoxin HigA